MIIPVNKSWRIRSDRYCWMVERRKVVKGKDRWAAETYHQSAGKALQECAQRRVRACEGNITDLFDQLQVIDWEIKLAAERVDMGVGRMGGP